MTNIPNSFSLPSSDISRKQKVEKGIHKDKVWSIASAMTGIRTHMELQNPLKLMTLKAEADLNILPEAAEARVEAVRSKPNPISTRKQRIKMIENHFRKYSTPCKKETLNFLNSNEQSMSNALVLCPESDSFQPLRAIESSRNERILSLMQYSLSQTIP